MSYARDQGATYAHILRSKERRDLVGDVDLRTSFLGLDVTKVADVASGVGGSTVGFLKVQAELCHRLGSVRLGFI